MKLSDNERAVISAYEMDADIPFTLGKKRTGLSESQISYALKGLQDRGVLQYYPFIDVFPLGYTPYLLYLSFDSPNSTAQKQVIEAFKKSDQVSWFTRFEGDYDYCASILAAGPQEFLTIAERLLAAGATALKAKTVVMQTSLTLFQAKYIGKPERVRHVSWGNFSSEQNLDEIDRRILTKLVREQYRSKRELARLLNMAPSTVDDRLSSLAERGVIVRFVYLINPKAFGFQSFKVLLTARVIHSQMTKLLFEFCRNEPSCVIMITCIGTWDYELGLEVREREEALDFIERLKKKFSQLISSVSMLNQQEEMKDFCYPFMS